jgi:hypothetical protein
MVTVPTQLAVRAMHTVCVALGRHLSSCWAARVAAGVARSKSHSRTAQPLKLRPTASASFLWCNRFGLLRIRYSKVILMSFIVCRAMCSPQDMVCSIAAWDMDRLYGSPSAALASAVSTTYGKTVPS